MAKRGKEWSPRAPKAIPFQKGDLILPHGGTYPKDALEVVEVLLDTQQFRASPEGGGTVYLFGLQALAKYGFRKVKEEERQPKWYKAKFSIDSITDWYPGWTLGDRWNGWATPGFELETAKKLLDAMVAQTKAERWDGVERYEYDPKEDAILIYETSYPDEHDTVKGFWAEVGKGLQHLTGAQAVPERLKLYPVGSYAWTWSERPIGAA